MKASTVKKQKGSPAVETGKGEWALGFDVWDEAAVSEVLEIPGIRIDRTSGRAVGSIDSIAALCSVQGVPLPVGDAVWHDKSGLNVPKKLAGTLHPYQVHGVETLSAILQKHGGGVLADDMGLGKTRQTICTALNLSGDDKKWIVCPASVRETWREELKKCGVKSDAIAILGPPSSSAYAKEWKLAPDAEWIVSSYELADQALSVAFPYEMPDFLALDECHMVKGRKAQRSNAIEKAAMYARYRLLITGTPIWSRPKDLWKLLRISLHMRFGSAFNFDKRYCEGFINAYGGMDNTGLSNADELKLRLSYYMVRRVKDDVLTQLPPLTRQVIWCDPTKEGMTGLRSVMLGKKSAVSVQDALHATLLGKIQVACDLAAEAKKFLLFTYRRADARAIAKKLNTEGTECLCITGDQSTDERNKLAHLAKTRGIGVVATIDSMSVGVNLQGIAHIGIFHALDYVPPKMLQAEARLHRLGQPNAVTWYYLAMRQTMDELVIHNIMEKLDQWTKVMGKDQASKMRGALDAAVGSGEEAEKAALAALFEQLEAAEQ